MDGDQYADRMASRLPVVLRDGPNINRLFLALGTELAKMDRATTLLMRSRWYTLARGWPQQESQRAQQLTTELGRIGALYGLEPSPDETADQFRRHLYQYIAIHRAGLGAAAAILHLVALEYRAERPPQISWEAGVTVGTFRVRSQSGPRDVRVELVDAPVTPNSAYRPNVAPRENISLYNGGLDSVVPDITLTAIDNDIAVPVLTHVETGLRVMFLGRVPPGSSLTLRHRKPPLLDGLLADGPVFVSDATRFSDPPDVFTRLYSPPQVLTRFSSFEPSYSLPTMPTEENRWQHDTLTRGELAGFLSGQPEMMGFVDRGEEQRQAHPAHLYFRWTEAAPTTFALRIPATYLPAHFDSFDDLADALIPVLEYGRAAGIRARLELVLGLGQETLPAQEGGLDLQVTAFGRETHEASGDFPPPRVNLQFREEVAQPSELLATSGIFDNSYLDTAIFLEGPEGEDRT